MSGADRNPFRRQVDMAARSALASCDSGGSDSVATILGILAANDLLTFGFSDPTVAGPQPGDMARACAVMAALAEHSNTLASIFMVSGLLAPLCVSYGGTDEQKVAVLPKVAAGKLQMSFALTEPGAGSDAAGITTTAFPQDNESYLVRGEKTYITGAATADIVLTVAKTAPDNPKAFGVLMVPGGAENLTIEPLSKIAGNTYPSCRVTFDGVRVGAADVLGGVKGLAAAWPILRNTGTLERLVVSAMACGIAQAATRRATEFIRDRRQFGKPLTEFQAVQHAVVEMSTLTRGMQLFLDHAVGEHAECSDPTQAISMAKYFCSEQLQRVVEIAVRVLGGRAYFDFEPVSRLYREAPFCLFAGGTVEIQKMLIARSLAI